MASWIEDYAMIGDGRTAALVSRYGPIDWLCLPRFDSDARCAALLGNEQNGYWRIAPCEPAETQRAYEDDTLVLQTRFSTASGRVCLADFMPPDTKHPVLIRRLTGLGGRVRLRCEFALRFDYGLVAPRMRQLDDQLLAVVGPDLVSLRAPVRLGSDGRDAMEAEFDVAAGQELAFVLSYGPSHDPPPAAVDVARAYAGTLAFWRDWAARFERTTPWRGPVIRSLLTLKALTYHPTGGLVAAATTSLPEIPGGTMNWDYRYCWLRDASFTLAALLNAGFHDEAIAWRDWMLRAIAASADKMRIMYRIDGGRRLHEWTVDWLSGYEGAAPVRVGNDAASQAQIDAVGEMLDALDLIARSGVEQTADAVSAERDLLQHLEATWQDKGDGLWESRAAPRRRTYSTVMAWVGVDRFISSRERCGDADTAVLDQLRDLRTRIHNDVTSHCGNFARGYFVDHYGGEQLDASLLLLPLVGFLPADDPRMAATIDAIERDLSEDGLVWRNIEGRGAGQGAFIACSCWLADCRALQGRRDVAVALLERVLALRNDVGLLSEEYHAGMRRLVGNLPQALSHVALVNTALGLSGPVLQRGGG